MKLKGEDHKDLNDEDRILPLINVVFLLLIFFMITGALTPVDPFEIEPSVSSSDSPIERDDFQISISGHGDFALNSELIEAKQIVSQFKAKVESGALGLVEIKADRETQGNLVITFMNELKEVGVERINLVTEQKVN